MSDDSNTYLTADAPLAKEPVGLRLKALRETRGLTLDNFVVFSALPQSRIEAFERGEYSKIGIDTFVVGYIRKYASWLDVDVNAYISEYHREPDTHKRIKAKQDRGTDSLLVSKSQSKLSHSYSRPKRKTFSAKVLALIVLILLCSLFLVVFLFASGKLNQVSASVNTSNKPGVISASPLFDDSAAPLTVEAASDAPSEYQHASTATPVLPSIQAKQGTPFSQKVSGDVSVENLPASRNGIPSSNVAHNDKAKLDGALLSQPNSRSLDTTESIIKPDAVSITADATVDKVTEPLDDRSDLQSNGSDTLTFTFTEDCWLEISSNDRALFVGLKRAGTTYVQQGDAPFSIMLGNVKAVSLLLNNEPYNIQPVAGRNTLRFIAAAP